MKSLFISIILILFFNTLNAEPVGSIFVAISNDTVHIWNTGVHENCGCLFMMDVSISNDTIYVTEVDTASNWANCMCNFDLCASITGLQSGDYFVKVFRFMPLFYPYTLFYIGSISFTYGGSALAFVSQSYQSDCYNISEVKEIKEHPQEFMLDQNYPNPFNPNTTIHFELPKESHVTFKVYNILGQEVLTVLNEVKVAGRYDIRLDGSELSSGVYFYRIQVYPASGGAGTFIDTKKMILLK